MWDLSPTLVRYENIEPPSVAVNLLGLAQMTKSLEGAKVHNEEDTFKLNISNFYQTDVISRR